jgi:hypothetical protein
MWAALAPGSAAEDGRAAAARRTPLEAVEKLLTISAPLSKICGWIGATTDERHFNGVAVSRTSGPMRTTSSSWKRLASAMLRAPGPANAGRPPPPMRTGAM